MDCAVDLADNAESAALLYQLSPAAWRVLEIWSAVQTQWNVGMAGRTSLNYPGVEVVVRAMGDELDEDLLGHLRTLEIIELTKSAEREERRREMESTMKRLGGSGMKPLRGQTQQVPIEEMMRAAGIKLDE